MERHLSIVTAAAAVLGLGGCTAVHVTAAKPSQHYPDAQAVYDVRPEALGSAFRYRYYPRVQVYFSPDRACYYWLEGGRWCTGRQLPPGVRFRANEGVDITLDCDLPYTDHDRVRARYNDGAPGKSWEAGRARDGDEDRHEDSYKGEDDDNDNEKGKDKDKDKGNDNGNGKSKGKGKGKGKGNGGGGQDHDDA